MTAAAKRVTAMDHPRRSKRLKPELRTGGLRHLDGSLPEDGERLEALYGHVPWIHYPADSIRD